MIEGTPKSPKIRYLGGGDAAFGAYVQQNWRSGLSSQQTRELVHDFFSQNQK